MIAAMLQRLTRCGSLLEISWAEDDKVWDVVWITGGVRYMASHEKLDQALSRVWVEAAADHAISASS